MSFLKRLSSYLADAKKIGYTWRDLVKKATRQNVINKVQKYKNDKILYEAIKARVDGAQKGLRLQQMEDEVKRNHKRLIRRQKQPRINIEQVDKALKGYTKSYEISVKNNKDPLEQLQNTRKAIAYHLISVLASFKGIKFVETLKVTFSKANDDGLIYKSAFF